MAKTRKDIILDTGEQLFAVRGYDGVSMRMVADAAKVGLGLVTYHFRNKDALFEEVVTRRAQVLSIARLESIRSLTSPTLEELLRAFFIPYQTLIETGDPGWRAYARLHAMITQDARWVGLATRNFGEVADEMIRLIMRSEPRLNLAKAARAYVLLIGTMVIVFADTGLAARLTRDTESSDDIGENIANMIWFAASGIRGIAQASPN